jgi:biopolymer transport protein ExbD
MALQIGKRKVSDEPEVMMEINTTPLIDVMLVLLVMLIITIPIQLHAVNLEMPVGVPPVLEKVEKIRIDIDADNHLQWNGLTVSMTELDQKMQTIGQSAVQPEVHIRPDKDARYAVFANVLAGSKRHGLTKIAVIGAEQFVQ